MHPLRILPLAALAGFLLAQPAPAQERVRHHFDVDKPFAAPAFFDSVLLSGEAKAIWMILPDATHNPPSPPNQVTQREGERPAGSVAAAIRRTYTFQDGRVSVAIKKQPGVAGLVLRMAGEKDYLLVLVDDTGALSAASVRRGESTILARGSSALDREWNVLSLELSGAKVQASVNGKPALEATDPAPAAGRAGLATEGPGSTSFDELVLEIAK